jgi:NADPH-dependent 2,4-dienoyl-CoA reductase/sulfur reductase-like enzyme
MADDIKRIVVVGGGLGGAKTVQALREQGYGGELTLVSGESELPYERPPLSKAYLMGAEPFEKAVVHPAEWYGANGVDLRRGVRATAIDPSAGTVRLDDASERGFDRLVLATGSVPRRLPLDGADAPNVLTLRTRADSDAIKATFGPDRRLVVIGAGWIGLEVAAAAREVGTAVTVVEAAAQPLLAVLGETIAPVFADLHRANDVDLRLGAQVVAIATGAGRATGVRLGDGSEVPADAVLVGIGARPDVELAEQAGLAVDNGVLVDAALRSSDPRIYAVGDIANHDHPVLGRRIRVEHWAAALNQPAVAARAIRGEDAVYDSLPYFFSDQYNLGMEYVGYADPQSRVVVRGDLSALEFVAFWLDGADHIQAAMNVNVWDVPDAVKPLIADRVRIDPQRLADPAVALSDVAR